MSAGPGHEPGHGFSWGDYVEWLVESHGSLAAVAERLSALRAYQEDAGSIERALRRLRTKGQTAGGSWGTRVLAAFGLPDAADARTRWMGAYHSRFVDLPVPLCLDLVRMWDRPPVNEAPAARMWLAIAHATCALRSADVPAAKEHHRRARASFALGPPDARAELLLAEAFIASRDEKERVPALLAEVEPLLAEPMPADDRACLHARLVDQRAYDINKRGDLAAAEELYRALPESGVPAFALARRANGLAYARWKLNAKDEAIAFARASVRHAGDGGHLRLRAMGLSMLGRILGGAEGDAARARADAIVTSLDDEGLRLRFRYGARNEQEPSDDRAARR